MISELVFLLLFVSLNGQSLVTLSDDFDSTAAYISHLNENDDCGKPLFLSPFIETKKINEALNLSRVTDLEHMIKSHSGFLTVNKRFKTNLFFWFFKAKSENWENRPVLLWLQGGPGATSLYALFLENGPFEVQRTPSNEFTLVNRKYAWTNEYNIIYIDNPAGSGYSHTHSEQGYAKNQKQVSNNLYKALIQFFQLFPNLQKNSFIITGESYAGKYIPSLGFKIHSANKKSKNKINLTGLFIGNAFISPGDQLIYGDYLQMIGLIDEHQEQDFNARQAQVKTFIDQQDWLSATSTFSELFFQSVYKYPTLYHNYTGFSQHYNYINDSKTENYKNFINFITKASTRKMIHVGNTPWGNYTTVVTHLKADLMKSVKPWLEKLLDHYDILFYSGQLDVICAYPSLVNVFKQLKWSAKEEYKNAERLKWYVENEHAGYYKRAGKFIEVMVRNTGHMVPTDNPLWALTLLNQFVSKNW